MVYSLSLTPIPGVTDVEEIVLASLRCVRTTHGEVSCWGIGVPARRLLL